MAASCSYDLVNSIESNAVNFDNLTPKYKRMIFLTCEVAYLSTTHYRVGCCIFDKSGDRKSFGFSVNRTHPLQAKFNKNNNKIFLHAEISALAQNKDNGVDESDIAVIVRRNKIGFANSAPCDGCFSAFIAFGIKRTLFYLDGRFYLTKIG